MINANKYKIIFLLFSVILFAVSISAQTFKAQDYYQLADGNEWRYSAPPGWKDGDYVSKIERDPEINHWDTKNSPQRFFHFDATKAAKILSLNKDGAIGYAGELFADGTRVVFDKPITWFPAKLRIGDRIEEQREFVRTFKEGKSARGSFQIKQTIVRLEDVKVSAGDFKKALRVESETFWDLGDGRQARSINVYHYAKKVGVVKASARFIIINAEGKEVINRLVETDLKSYKISK